MADPGGKKGINYVTKDRPKTKTITVIVQSVLFEICSLRGNVAFDPEIEAF